MKLLPVYRVWNDVSRQAGTGLSGVRRLYYSVASPQEGRDAIRLLEARRNEDAAVISSEYGLEILSLSGWSEWQDEHGNDVTGSSQVRALLERVP